MNACLYCEAELPPFKAFCNSTCEGLFGIAEPHECAVCRENYRVVGCTRDGRPVMGCQTCGESFEVLASAGAA